MIQNEKLFRPNAEAWYDKASRAPCTNFDPRPDGTVISLLVIHNISLPPGQFGGSYIEDLFANQLDCDAHPYFARLRDLKVSAHFLLRRDGAAMQFVATDQRAWHAGMSIFNGQPRCNDFSIGIELEGSDFEPFTDAQYQALTQLTLALRLQHPLTDVAGHEHIAPGRKTDPGPFFDWQRYRREYLTLLEQSASDIKISADLRFPN